MLHRLEALPQELSKVLLSPITTIFSSAADVVELVSKPRLLLRCDLMLLPWRWAIAKQDKHI